MPARSISCRACPAATRIFFGVQPRFGQVPPKSRDSIIATDRPARRAGPVTPIPALPPPKITTSKESAVIEPTPMVAKHRPAGGQGPPRQPALLLCSDGRCNGVDDLGGHLE